MSWMAGPRSEARVGPIGAIAARNRALPTVRVERGNSAGPTHWRPHSGLGHQDQRHGAGFLEPWHSTWTLEPNAILGWPCPHWIEGSGSAIGPAYRCSGRKAAVAGRHAAVRSNSAAGHGTDPC